MHATVFSSQKGFLTHRDFRQLSMLTVSLSGNRLPVHKSNTSGTGHLLMKWINTMATDAFTPCVARSSAGMVLTIAYLKRAGEVELIEEWYKDPGTDDECQRAAYTGQPVLHPGRVHLCRVPQHQHRRDVGHRDRHCHRKPAQRPPRQEVLAWWLLTGAGDTVVDADGEREGESNGEDSPVCRVEAAERHAGTDTRPMFPSGKAKTTSQYNGSLSKYRDSYYKDKTVLFL